MPVLRALIALVLLGSALALNSTAWADQMTFYGEMPGAHRLMGTDAWDIFADGAIDADAGKRLDHFINAHGVPDGSLIILNSAGGNLLGGMALGRVIRQHRLSSYVGRKGDYYGAKGFESIRIKPGVCLSSCTLAFLGGEYRYIDKESVYGVHRFFWQNKGPNDSDVAQMLSATIIQYIRDMEVDPSLFTFMTRAGAEELFVLPQSDLLRLNVINNGAKTERWSIGSADDRLFLKGEQETVRGLNKFVIVCTEARTLSLLVMFDAGTHTNEVLHFPAQSLLIDGQPISIEGMSVAPASVVEGLVLAVYRLDEVLLGRIAKAKTVGVAFQVTQEAPIFMGTAQLNFADGAKMLPGFVQTCVGK